MKGQVSKAVREEVHPPRERVYGKAVREALIALWEASGRVCGSGSRLW
jgi:hypothetical protein